MGSKPDFLKMEAVNKKGNQDSNESPDELIDINDLLPILYLHKICISSLTIQIDAVPNTFLRVIILVKFLRQNERTLKK